MRTTGGRRSRRLAVAAGTAVLAMTVSARGAEVIEAGDVAVLVGEETDEGMDALLVGALEVVDGCLGVATEGAVSVVVWPHGTEVTDEDPLTIDLPGDGERRIGDEVEIGGGFSDGDEIGGLDVREECGVGSAFLAAPR